MQRSVAHVAQYDSEDKRQDVSFKYTFDKDTELVGNMKLKLWVSTKDSDDMIYLQVLKVRSSVMKLTSLILIILKMVK